MTASAVLVLGGQRSGKSRYAEDIVAGSGRTAIYLATATAGDEEMAERIARHRARRSGWRTIEEPLAIAETIVGAGRDDTVILVDCLTLWLSNLIGANREPDNETARLLAALGAARGSVVFVSNEVGSGVIPDNPLARRYTDALGTLNQRVAAVVSRVVLLTAGIPMLLKPAQRAEIVL